MIYNSPETLISIPLDRNVYMKFPPKFPLKLFFLLIMSIVQLVRNKMEELCLQPSWN